MDYFLFILVGFLGSYHCIGMCGFIPPLIQYKNWFLGNIFYNLGRIFTYSFLGFVAGYIGMFFHSLQFQILQKGLSLFLGIFMIVLGLQILGNLKDKGIPGLDMLFITIADILSKFRKNPFFLGMFNGFLPCPLVYAMLMQSVLEKSPVKGFFIMTLFGLGTIPAMFFSSLVFNKLSPIFRKKLASLSGLIVILLGVLAILRSFGIGHHH